MSYDPIPARIGIHPGFRPPRLPSFAALLLLCTALSLTAATHPPLNSIVDLTTRTNLLTESEIQWLNRNPVIRLAPHRKYQPLESNDGTTNAYHGMVAEYVRIMEHRLGRPFNFVFLSDEQWHDLDPESRGADVIPATSETLERARYWAYTQPYIQLPTYLITRQNYRENISLQDLSGSKVAVVGGWAAETYVRENFPEVIVLPVRDVPTGLRSVSFGLVDAFISELPVATEWTESLGITNLKISGDAGHIYRIRMGIRRDWPELRDILDKAMATITHEERELLYKRWVKIHAPQFIDTRWKKGLLWGASLMSLVLLGITSWNRSLSRKVQQRTAALQTELSRRLEADQLLRSSEEKFSKAFQGSPLPLCITTLADDQIIDANPAFLRLFHVQNLSELTGRTTLDLGFWARPDDRQWVLNQIRSEGRVLNLKHAFHPRQGSPSTGLCSFEQVDLSSTPCLIILINDITELEKLEADRQRLRQQLKKTEEEERRRIARELHDTTAQHLTALQMNLNRLRNTLPEPAPSQLLTDSLQLTAQSVQEIRTLTYLLHPPLLEELGLAGALTDYAKGFAKRAGLQIDVDASHFQGPLPNEVELTLFRVAQEALTNAHRHSGTHGVLIRLDRDDAEVRLEIQDSGRGLPPHTTPGVGLRGMQERLRQIGGDLQIESDHEGTTLLASVPISSPLHRQTSLLHPSPGQTDSSPP